MQHSESQTKHRQITEIVYPSARRHRAVKIILKNSRIYFFHSGEEKTESRACCVKTVGDFPETVGDLPETVGDFPETVGDFSETVGDFSETVGDFFLKADKKNLRASETTEKSGIPYLIFSPFDFL